VTKTAKPTHHGAWTGAAVGALVGIIFPPAVGESRIEEQLEKALTHANKLVEKQVAADADELEREIDEAAQEREPGPPGKRPAVANTQPGIPLALMA